jgi:hypothetical protein
MLVPWGYESCLTISAFCYVPYTKYRSEGLLPSKSSRFACFVVPRRGHEWCFTVSLF